MNKLLAQLFSLFSGQGQPEVKGISATQDQVAKYFPTGTPTPTPTPTRDQYINAMNKGFEYYGNPPAATLSAQMYDAMAPFEIFKKFPFLIPIVSILESGGGGNMSNRQKPHNITSWGINLPKDIWNPGSVEEVISKTASGIGQRSPYYQKFRESGDLRDLAYNYTNPNVDDTEKYIKDYNAINSIFQSFLNK